MTPAARYYDVDMSLYLDTYIHYEALAWHILEHDWHSLEHVWHVIHTYICMLGVANAQVSAR